MLFCKIRKFLSCASKSIFSEVIIFSGCYPIVCKALRMKLYLHMWNCALVVTSLCPITWQEYIKYELKENKSFVDIFKLMNLFPKTNDLEIRLSLANSWTWLLFLQILTFLYHLFLWQLTFADFLSSELNPFI